MENLFSVLNSHFEINLIIKSFLLSATRVESYKKAHKIISQGDYVNRLYFNEKGIIRKSININNKNITLHYILPGNFFTSILSLSPETKDSPSPYTYELINPGQICSIDFDNLFLFVKEFPLIKKVYDKVIQDYYLLEEKRAIEFQTLSAVERYNIFVAEFAEVFEYAKLRDIAGLLGINHATLSRIRAKLKEESLP
jgi:CRP/FNR family transcriptional regulator, anaerobic regulatory protein